MTIRRAVIVLALAMGFAGCGAREPAQTEEPATAAAGGESASPADSPRSELEDGYYEAEGDYEGEGNGTGEAGPPEEYEDLESMDATNAYDQLRVMETYADQLLDNGSSDCPEAERLVGDICYLADRVCELGDVEEDSRGAACDESRARCARSRARLARSCP